MTRVDLLTEITRLRAALADKEKDIAGWLEVKKQLIKERDEARRERDLALKTIRELQERVSGIF